MFLVQLIKDWLSLKKLDQPSRKKQKKNKKTKKTGFLKTITKPRRNNQNKEEVRSSKELGSHPSGKLSWWVWVSERAEQQQLAIFLLLAGTRARADAERQPCSHLLGPTSWFWLYILVISQCQGRPDDWHWFGGFHCVHGRGGESTRLEASHSSIWWLIG